MNIKEKLATNPELIEANTLVGNALGDLIDRKWGSVTMTFSAQNGKITTIKINDEKIFKISDNSFEKKS